jgi:threonine dehydrogenase-like Zn-dependent dehydrogenase
LSAPTPPPGHVVVAVAGLALGVEPAAEIAGTVVATGDAAAEWLGRRVVVPRLLPCGDCDACRRARVAHCASRVVRGEIAFTQTLSTRWLCNVEPPLWPEGEELWRLAALADAALAPYTALARAGVGPSDPVVVIGNDARARFAAAIAAAKGAHVTVDDGSAPGRTPDGAIVVATTGASADRARALALAGDGATVVFLDGPAGDAATGAFAVDWSRLVAREVRILGVVGGHPDLLPELCALVVRRQLSLADAVHSIPAAEHQAAHAAYRARGGSLPIALPAA